ncbi:hypothetical protein [Thalassomonas sp. M1454]|uniref:hypothetical protein n=1 Tax=Thalassomonas sp. M1454 TaxID=2594477 RepID=UPI00117CBEFE|nr:hypothetical protein [Thalassomonas sp. M1454]TRX56827.1 hypothetical protein FNN08_04725 [Thalassomonas sp. M1454]
MNQTVFRLLIGIYLVVSIGKSIANQQYLFWLQAPEIINAWNAHNTFILDLRNLPLIVNLIQVPLNLFLFLYGALGMAFYWRYAREVFLLSSLPLSFVYIFMVTSHLSHAGTVAIDAFEWFLTGGIVSLAYFSNVSENFKRKRVIVNDV